MLSTFATLYKRNHFSIARTFRTMTSAPVRTALPSCIVRSRRRLRSVHRHLPMWPTASTTPMRSSGQPSRALPRASAARCLVRMRPAPVHRSSRSCTDCTAANKQINRWKAAAGECPCRRLFTDPLRHFTLWSELHSRTNRCNKSGEIGGNVIFSVKLRKRVIISSFFVKPC